jgi:hypothetical protein
LWFIHILHFQHWLCIHLVLYFLSKKVLFEESKM